MLKLFNEITRYICEGFSRVLINLITALDGIPINKTIASSFLYVIFQTHFAELHVHEIVGTIKFEPSTI